jgi:hypothetical protein
MLERAGKPNPPCDKIADGLALALPVAYPEPSKDSIPAYRVLGKCASDTKRWRAAVRAAATLLALGDENEKAMTAIVRGLAEMGEHDKAIAAAQDLAKRYPKAQAMLMASMTFVYCRAEAWERCIATGDAVLAAFAKAKIDRKSDSVKLTRTLRDLGWIAGGQPAKGLADLAALEKEFGPLPRGLDAIKAAGELAVERGYFLDVVPLPQLPIGVYHLMGRKDTGALVTLKLREHAKKARQFRVEVEVPGVTERSSNTLALRAGEATIKWANPPLKMDFDIAKVRGPRPSQLALKIVAIEPTGERVVIDETLPIEVLPRDYLPLRRKVGADSLVPTYGYMGAWVTSNDKSVDAFLTKAKERAPGRAFVGEQDATVAQVKALYDELKQRGVSYVMDPAVTAEQAFVQRTRLPAEVLASTNAQCLEGTLLFATLLEAVGIKPIIVLVPGHAFVGWKTVPKDGTQGEPLFLETTMVGMASFEDAVKVATRRVATELRAGSFKSGAATFIDVAALRTAGFAAQPL